MVRARHDQRGRRGKLVAKFLTLLGVLALALAPVLDAHSCSMKVRWYDDQPYSFRRADGSIGGFDVDLMREALRRTGCRAVFIEMPWARALVELQAGRLDALPGSFRSAQRDAFAHFSAPSLQSQNVLYMGPKARANYRFASLGDMLGTEFRLGVQIGVSYGDAFETLKTNPRFMSNQVPVTLRRAAWKMMELGRIDGMIADEASAALELEQLGLSGTLQPSGIVVSTSTAMIAFSKRTVSTQFVAAFDKALQAMFADGQYRRIRGRYLRCPRAGNVLGCN